MPVRKFRSIEEMAPPPWLVPGDPALERAIGFVLTTAARMSGLRFPPGVHKHRSIAEMDMTQEQWRIAGRRPG